MDSHAIPQLSTTLTEPLHSLEKRLLCERHEIEKWLQTQWAITPPPVYGSVDLRNAGFKLAPVDMNLFPAGFNNLNPQFLSHAICAAQAVIARYMPHAQKILVVPESHSRNRFYWGNIKILQTLLEQAGFQVRLGTLVAEITQPSDIELAEGKVTIEPLLRQHDRLLVGDFDPDLILLNNDLSEGIPAILQNLQQEIIPPAELGWSQRLKSGHFHYYAEVSHELAQRIDIDPWLIAPLFRQCGDIDFMQKEGLDCLTHHVNKLFAEIQAKYDEYRIPYKPFLIVKADAGTYGMAVMTVRHPDELIDLNRKQRTRMATTKGGQPVNRVIIQEGVYTFETWGQNQDVAEPVVYMWGEHVIGGFYRVHKERGIDENLNAPGMHFEPLAFAQSCRDPREDMSPDACQNRLFVYGIIAQLSMLAAAREIKDQKSL